MHFGWLYALSLIACLSHPALDWLNNYGVRLLEPFSSRWFNGDVLFIINLWLWLGLGFAAWLSLRREKKTGCDWRTPARIALAASLAYIGLNAAITWQAEQRTRASAPYPSIAIASEVPVLFWRREIISGNGDGIWHVGGRTVGDIPLDRCDLDAVRAQNSAAHAFLFWSRAPFVERLPSGRVAAERCPLRLAWRQPL